jgi:uncharacterized peroxidase-related enzyme
MSAEYKIGLAPVTNEAATGVAKEILDTTQAGLGFVPNMYRAMATSAGYLSTYAHGYNEFRQNSGFTPPEQELVFLVISRENGCDYCTAAHSLVAEKMSKLDAETLAAVRANALIENEKLRALASFTSSVFLTRGRVTQAQADAFLSAGYEEKQIMEIILAVAVKTLSNYSNHVFHTELDDVFKPYAVQSDGSVEFQKSA